MCYLISCPPLGSRPHRADGLGKWWIPVVFRSFSVIKGWIYYVFEFPILYHSSHPFYLFLLLNCLQRNCFFICLVQIPKYWIVFTKQNKKYSFPDYTNCLNESRKSTLHPCWQFKFMLCGPFFFFKPHSETIHCFPGLLRPECSQHDYVFLFPLADRLAVWRMCTAWGTAGRTRTRPAWRHNSKTQQR